MEELSLLRGLVAEREAELVMARAELANALAVRDAASRMLAVKRQLAENSVDPRKHDELQRAHRAFQTQCAQLRSDLDVRRARGSEGDPGEGVCDFCEAVADGSGYARAYDGRVGCWDKLRGFLRRGPASSEEEEPTEGECDFCEAGVEEPGFVYSYDVCDPCWGLLSGSGG